MKLTSFYSVVDCGLRAVDGIGLFDRIQCASDIVVLMYHGVLRRKYSPIMGQAVDREGFARQIQYLKKRCRIVQPDEINDGYSKLSGRAERSVLLTFDDGFANNATIVRPILEELNVPALFFVCTRHLEHGQYLWFAHARALFSLWPTRVELLGRTFELSSSSAREWAFREFKKLAHQLTVDEVYRALLPYPVEQYASPQTIEDELRGMSEGDLAAIAKTDLIVIGAHTCNHPFLTRCSKRQLEAEIACAKLKLEQICGRAVTNFAYPDGDYNSAVASAVTKAGFRNAFAVDVRDSVAAGMAIPRAGIYRAGTGILAAKLCGVLN